MTEWYPRGKDRDQSARQRYFQQDRDGWQKGELYMPKILDMKQYAAWLMPFTAPRMIACLQMCKIHMVIRCVFMLVKRH